MRTQYAANRDAIDALGVVRWTARAGTWAIESIDPGVVRMLGYASDAWRAEGFWLDRTHNRDRRRLRSFLDHSQEVRPDRGAFCEYRIYDAGGSVRWLRTSVLRADDDGRTVTGAHLDVTDEHRVLEALGLTTRHLREALGLGEVAGKHPIASQPERARASGPHYTRSAERTYRTVWDALPASAGVLDRDGVVIEVNHAWVKLARRFGRDDAFLGASYLDVARQVGEWGNARASEAADGIRRVLLGVDESFSIDYSWSVPGESAERWFRVRAVRLEPAPLGALVMQEEITDHAAAESLTRRLDDLTHMQRLATLGELATTIAHDLNQPLTVIMTAASTISRLARNRPGDEELEPIARDILDAASRAADVMRQTRGIVRRDDAAVEPIQVNDIVSEVARLLKSDAIIRQVVIDLELDPAAGSVAGGRAQLEQVLMNLLLNAIEAVSEQPSGRRNVRVTTRRVSPSEVEIRVHDSGVGIPEPLRDRVFEPFVTTKRQGTGLGLAIVRAIVQAHGGQVRLETPQERGAAFRVTLPAC
jgi:signal transduction histidine kinase